MPSVEKMAEEAQGGPTFWHAYQRAYRWLSAWQHHDHGVFDEQVDGNAVSVDDALTDPLGLKLLGASITAAMLIVVGEIVDLPIVAGARTVRERLRLPLAT